MYSSLYSLIPYPSTALPPSLYPLISTSLFSISMSLFLYGRGFSDLLLYYAGWLDVCISHDKLRNWHSGSCEILEERLAKLSLEGRQAKDQTLDPTQKLATFSFCCNCCKYKRSINTAVRLIRIHEHLESIMVRIHIFNYCTILPRSLLINT